MNFIDFTGRKILITGASSGIGKQTALTLGKLGADVILVARREEKLKEVLNELDGNNNAYYAADLSETDRIEMLFKQIAEEQGRLDGMVYAAGIAMSLPLKLFKPEKIREVFNINYFGFIEAVRQICKKGRYNEGMRIVGVSSVASLQGDKAHLAYSGSKAAMDASVRCIAKEVADKGICINTVAPAMPSPLTETQAKRLFWAYPDNWSALKDAAKKFDPGLYAEIASTTSSANIVKYVKDDAGTKFA